MTAFAIQPIPAVLTTTEAAAVLRCSVETVERYVHTHELMAIQVGRERRIRGVDLLDFIDCKRATCHASKQSNGHKGNGHKVMR